MYGTNRPPFTAADIWDASERQWPKTTQCACNPGCMSCSPSCRTSGPPDRPFGLPADSVEIALDLPMPTSTNRLYGRGRKGIHKSAEYVRWMEAADLAIMAAKAYPKRKIAGPFELEVLLSTDHRGDGDNRLKSLLDYIQSRDIVRNDVDCRRGSWAWVEPDRAPAGCRVILRTLHG